MTATASTYPLDLVRGRISGKVAMDKAYTTVYETFRVTVRDDDIRGLYKGLAPTMLGAMPYVGIQFGTVGVLERQFPDTDTTIPSPWRKTLFGGLGGVRDLSNDRSHQSLVSLTDGKLHGGTTSWPRVKFGYRRTKTICIRTIGS
jgi:Mitochondrial carrier protein